MTRRPTTAAHRAGRARRVRDRARSGRRRDRRRARCRPGAGCWRAGRTARSGRPRTRSGCRPARWATPRWATSTSARAGPCSRTCRASTPRSPTARSSTRPAFLAACERAREGRGTALDQPHRPGRRPCQRPAPRRPRRAGRGPGRAERSVHALLDGRDTPPSSALGFMPSTSRRGSPPSIPARRSPRSAAATTRWTGIAAGTASSAATTRSSTARRPTTRRRRRGDRGGLRPGRDRRVRGPDRHRRREPGRSATGDPVVHANFRADRARQLTHALADGPAFDGFDRTSPAGRPAPTDLLVVTMTEYEEGLPVLVAFPPETARSLAQAFSEAGWRQFHVAETEKYAHVTYFFNGGVEAPVAGRGPRADPEPEGRDLRPRSRRCRRRRRHGRPRRGDRVGRLRLHRRELRQPRHGRPHRGVGRDDRGAGGHRPASPGSSAPSRPSRRRTRTVRVRCWPSRPTTATRTSCAMRPARRSPPTRSTPCRSCWSGVPWPAARSADGVLADVAPTLLELADLPPWPAITGRSLRRREGLGLNALW